MKGISTIIAAIILVVITIGLISVAYLYMSGLITGTTVTNIALLDAYCEPTDNNITILIKNDGTADITSSDFMWLVDGDDYSDQVYPSTDCHGAGTLGGGASRSCTIHGQGALTITDAFHEIRVIGPSNAVGGTLECK